MDWEFLNFDFDGVEYDQSKEASNYQKHSVTFAEAAEIFEHPVLARFDDAAREARYTVIGISRKQFLVFAITERPPNLRIISARKAAPAERRWDGAHLK